MKKAIITGITGQDGSYLAELLLDKGYEVHGMVRRSSTETFERIEHLRRPDHAAPGRPARSAVDHRRAAARCGPTRSTTWPPCRFVPTSWKQPVLTGEFTAVGVTRVLEAIRLLDPKGIRFYQASSQRDVRQGAGGAAEETTPFYPRSPYGVAKVYGHCITVNYRESYGMFACSGILFNHESPRRGLEFVTRKVTDGVARIKLGLANGAAPGQPRRQARLGLRRRLRPGHVADAPAGPARRLRHRHRRDALGRASWSRTAFGCVGLDWRKYVVQDPALIRPAEVDLLVGDAEQGQARAGLGADSRLPRNWSA